MYRPMISKVSLHDVSNESHLFFERNYLSFIKPFTELLLQWVKVFNDLS